MAFPALLTGKFQTKTVLDYDRIYGPYQAIRP